MRPSRKDIFYRKDDSLEKQIGHAKMFEKANEKLKEKEDLKKDQEEQTQTNIGLKQ